MPKAKTTTRKFRTDEEKAAIIAQAVEGVTLVEVAARSGCTPQQITLWRATVPRKLIDKAVELQAAKARVENGRSAEPPPVEPVEPEMPADFEVKPPHRVLGPAPVERPLRTANGNGHTPPKAKLEIIGLQGLIREMVRAELGAIVRSELEGMFGSKAP